MTPPAAFFVSVEGIDGSGKSTQVTALVAALRAAGRDAIAVRPHDTELGELVRRFVLQHGDPVDPWAEALLFFAGRAQLLRERILPALARGAVVVADRYTDSTLAYQGGGWGLPMEALLRLHESACQGMWPELTVYLDVPLDVAASRQQAQQLPLDRLEGAPESFHAAVRDAYEDLTSRFAHRFIRVDATRPPLLVARDIYEAVRLRLRLRDGAAVTAAERP